MKTTLGEELKKLIPEGTPQKAMAMTWLDAWRARHPKREILSADAAETRLSQCLSNRAPGVKFYFEDPARREITCEVFQVPPKDSARLGRLAEEILKEDLSPQLVLDATTGPQAGDELERMFQGIKTVFLGDNALWPMMLLITEQQYERLPRSYDDLKPKLTTQKFKDVASARGALGVLAEQGALAATPYPHLPFERWLAVRLSPEVKCDPPNGLAEFAADNTLPGLPVVTMPLARIAMSQPLAAKLPSADPIELRAVMRRLAAGDIGPRSAAPWHSARDEQHESVRLSWAQQLGITASATHAEWIQALPKRIAPVPLLESAEWLDRARWLASRNGSPAVFSFGGKVIALNPPEPVRAELTALGNVALEEIASAGFPALASLLDEAAAMNADDVLDDPFLDALLERHATGVTDATDQHALETARNGLLFSTTAFRPPPANAVEDWRGALDTLLEGMDPEGGLRLRIQRNGNEQDVPKGFIAPTTPISTAPWPGRLLGDILITRRQTLAAVKFTDRSEHTRERQEDPWQRIVVPSLPGAPARWVEHVLSTLAVNANGLARAPYPAPQRTTAPFEISQDRWETADRELAFLLGALRVAVKTATALTLPAGKVMLPLGGGIFAEVFVRAHAATASRSSVSSLVQPMTLDGERWQLHPPTKTLVTHRATSKWRDIETAIGVDLPHGVHLAGRGIRADVVLRCSPLLTRMSLPEPHVAAAVSAASADAARRAYESD
jgi:hypothetical protein